MLFKERDVVSRLTSTPTHTQDWSIPEDRDPVLAPSGARREDTLYHQSLFISERKTYVKIHHRVCTPPTWPPFVGASGGGGSPQHPSPTGIGEVSVPQPSAAGNCPRGTVPH